ncbi:MAG: PilZ domain-containing protein [Moraxella sp.]|nr:PilZ domain-containing protein [Moraxella sp.]
MVMPMRGGIITCHIADTHTLYNSYMSFVKGGGIFVPSTRKHAIGDDVFVAFTLPNSSERYPLNGKVVWVSEKGSGNKPAGFGMQFGNDPNSLKLKNEIERLLAGEISSDKSTYTM